MNERRWQPGDPVNWERPGELWTAGGVHAFVVESKGRQSGRTRRAILGYLAEGPNAWLVIASKGGAPTNPAWVYNLADNPDATVVMPEGTRVPVRAERLADEELDLAWERIAKEAPEYVAYRSRTKRPIPVIRLQRETR